MKYVIVDIMHIGKANWRAYIPLLDDFVDATSEDRVRHEAYRQIEEALGLKSFVITWREV